MGRNGVLGPSPDVFFDKNDYPPAGVSGKQVGGLGIRGAALDESAGHIEVVIWGFSVRIGCTQVKVVG